MEVAEHRMHRQLFIWKREERIRRALEAAGATDVKVTITKTIWDDVRELEKLIYDR